MKIYEIYAPEDIEAQHKNWMQQQKLEEIKKIVSLVPQDVYTVLDYGCGTGRYNVYFVDYTGFDRNKLMLEFAQKTYPDIEFLNKLPKQKYDLVLAVSVIQYYNEDDIKDILEEIFSCSRKYVIIQTWDKESGEVETKGGFRNITTYLRSWEFYIEILSKFGTVERHIIEKEEHGSKTVYIITK